MDIEYMNKGSGRMSVQEKNGVDYLTFPAYSDFKYVKHLFSTRTGGVSSGIYSAMNLSFSRGDRDEAVLENYKRIASVLNCKITDFVCTDQTHTTNVRRVGLADRGKGIVCEKDYRDVDGLITDDKGVVLTAVFADCVPLFLLDPVKKAIGLAHSGWRGTVNKMAGCMVHSMAESFGCEASSLIVGIGPCICQKCYEVSEDVAEQFLENFENAEENGIVVKGENKGKFQLDLVKANKAAFLESGVLEKNIQTSGICTCCNSQVLFSHRASHGKRGNLGAFMELCDDCN